MADRVIIVGLRRGGSLVPSSEIRQMMGRAGRDHSEEAIVELIVDEKDEGIIHELLKEGSMTVESSFSNPDILATSLMPEIHKRNVKTVEGAMVWCSRSFCENPAIDKALELLYEVDAVTETNGVLEPTPIGSCAAKFYFHPADVFTWWTNFTHLFDSGLENHELGPAWALGNVPYERIIGDLGERREIASECHIKMPLELDIMKGSVINVITWWYLMGGPSLGPLRLSCLERRKGFGRFRSALLYLNRHAGWEMEDFFDELDLRVRKGLPPELVPLCKFDGINKTRAVYLYSLGVECLKDFEGAINKIEDVDDDEFKQAVKKIARLSRNRND